MNWNKLKLFFAVYFVFVLMNVASGQNKVKIDKQLYKLYSEGKYEKLEKKTKKLKKKYPRLDVLNYYLAKNEMIKFHHYEKQPNKKQYNHLRKAGTYSKKLGKDYSYWIDSMKHYHQAYITSWYDINFESTHVKKVVLAYVKTYKDTLPVYFKYYGTKEVKANKITHEIPITDSLRTVLITFASELVGIPYVYTGEKPEDGFDCSGFVKYVYSSIDVELPHNAHMQSQLDGEILPIEEAQPGDLIFFGSGDSQRWSTQHAGIIYEYNEDEPKVIHCVSRGVSIDGNNSSWDHYWKERILFVKRLPQLNEKTHDSKSHGQ